MNAYIFASNPKQTNFPYPRNLQTQKNIYINRTTQANTKRTKKKTTLHKN